MATYRAIGATCEAVVGTLRQAWRPEMFYNASLQFAVYTTKDFATPMETGVSLFLYRVTLNGVQRTPPGRRGPLDQPRRTQLPLDLHFLLTPWAKQASLEQEILGWMMRIIEDTPTLPSGLLNSHIAGVFDSKETVELLPGDLSYEDMSRVWDVLPQDFHISVPYIARVVRIDSVFDTSGGGPVLTKQLDYGALKDG
jgi:hypothetical protein